MRVVALHPETRGSPRAASARAAAACRPPRRTSGTRCAARPGNEAPDSVVIGTANAAASDTTPRIPAHATTNTWAAGGRRVAFPSAGEQRARDVGEHVDPHDPHQQHRQEHRHRRPDHRRRRHAPHLADHAGQLQADQQERERLQDQLQGLPDRLVLQPGRVARVGGPLSQNSAATTTASTPELWISSATRYTMNGATSPIALSISGSSRGATG